ncbi:hypothetical protein [Spirosoma sordidisoli]|uniref:Uncharacterized protein n=1 Tax=Spirosoma sordidisoli TaxID=2502893 RepID=A0A4Q2URY9_9BACT|nr:hypothetical protein [Spirosoma sordidisoli]RYC69599.1 hypothetical protein EQG79_13430 [Spirosoma sordidisoli]
MKKAILITLSMIGLGVAVYQRPNALKVWHHGQTEVVRWPNAHAFNEGDIIYIPLENGMYWHATVIEPVSVDQHPIDDEPIYFPEP